MARTPRAAATTTRDRVGEPAATGANVSPDEHVERIVAAALRCFQRWGLSRTRVDDIAAELGKTRPYLYRYFASKDAIVLEVVVRSIRQHNAVLRERFPLDGPADDVATTLGVNIARQSIALLPGEVDPTRHRAYRDIL